MRILRSLTGEYIFKWFDQYIDEIGADKVIQIVTDNHSANMAAKVLLKAKRPGIFLTSCAAHTMDLMLEGISKLPAFKGVIAKAREITVFIYNHHKTLAMMRKTTEKEIVRPGATRFATNFLTLQSLHQHKPKLRLIFSDSKFHNLNAAKTAK